MRPNNLTLTLSIDTNNHVKAPEVAAQPIGNPVLNTSSRVQFSVDTANGLIMPARQCPSPNQDARPAGVVISALIVHAISLPPGEYGGGNIEKFFCNELDCDAHAYFAEIRELTVSAHLLIERSGDVVQFVPFSCRAWHAGESLFRGVPRCNDYSIGIELEGDDETPYTDAQYAALTGVARALCAAYPALGPRTMAGHCDVSPGRKTDPGPVFDWLRLYDGLAESEPKA